MELKEKIYPSLPEAREIPNAPPDINVGDNGQNFRLKKISDIQDFLEKELKEREGLYKKKINKN